MSLCPKGHIYYYSALYINSGVLFFSISYTLNLFYSINFEFTRMAVSLILTVNGVDDSFVFFIFFLEDILVLYFKLNCHGENFAKES